MYTYDDLMKDRRDAIFQRDLDVNEGILRKLAVSSVNEICLYDGGDKERMMALLRDRGFKVEVYFSGIKVSL